MKSKNGIKIKINKNAEFIFILDNDLKLTKEKFIKKLYVKIITSSFINEIGLSKNKKKFLRGFF